MPQKSELILSRRQFLIKSGAAFLGSFFLPNLSFAGTYFNHERALHLYNRHTAEWFKESYWAQGQYLPDALKRLNFLLRDKLNNKTTAINKGVLELMYALQNKAGLKKPVEIICGYRSLETNNQLRRKSNGVAKNSLHIQGRAVDLRMDHVNLKKLRDAAKSLKLGGVGYYPNSNFIHVDVRAQPYYW